MNKCRSSSGGGGDAHRRVIAEQRLDLAAEGFVARVVDDEVEQRAGELRVY